MSWLSRLFDPLRSTREANDAMIADAKKREWAKAAVDKQIASIRLDYDHNARRSPPMPFVECREILELEDRYKTIALFVRIAPNGTFSARQLRTAEEVLTDPNPGHQLSYSDMLRLNGSLSNDHDYPHSESA